MPVSGLAVYPTVGGREAYIRDWEGYLAWWGRYHPGYTRKEEYPPGRL